MGIIDFGDFVFPSSRRRRGALRIDNLARRGERRAAAELMRRPPATHGAAEGSEKRTVIEIVARSGAMREAMRLAGRVAPTYANGLVTG